MSKSTELASLSREDAARHRAELLATFSGRPNCVVGAFCLADESLLRELVTDVLYLNLASNNHQTKDRIASSPDRRAKLKGPAQLKDGLANDAAMVRAYPNHHAKYWLTGLLDEETPLGALFSGDLTPSALDPASDEANSHELLIVLDSAESLELRSFVRWLMTAKPRTEVLPHRELLLSGSLPKLPTFRKLLLTSPNKSLKREALALIASARETLDVTVWALDSDNEVFAKLMAAAKRVRVRLLAHEEPANRRALEELAQAGADVRFCPGMHAKVWLADRATAPSALVASANLLADGFEEGYELGVRLEPGDPRLASVASFVAGREAAARLWAPSSVPAEKAVRSLQQLDQVVRVAPRLKLF
jgi:hypothetical protein